MDEELKSLDATLRNIETARPFEDLTVVSDCSGTGGDGGLFFLGSGANSLSMCGLGRGCGRKTGYRRTDGSVGVERKVGRSWVQGWFFYFVPPPLG